MFKENQATIPLFCDWKFHHMVQVTFCTDQPVYFCSVPIQEAHSETLSNLSKETKTVRGKARFKSSYCFSLL